MLTKGSLSRHDCNLHIYFHLTFSNSTEACVVNVVRMHHYFRVCLDLMHPAQLGRMAFLYPTVVGLHHGTLATKVLFSFCLCSIYMWSVIRRSLPTNIRSRNLSGPTLADSGLKQISTHFHFFSLYTFYDLNFTTSLFANYRYTNIR